MEVSNGFMLKQFPGRFNFPDDYGFNWTPTHPTRTSHGAGTIEFSSLVSMSTQTTFPVFLSLSHYHHQHSDALTNTYSRLRIPLLSDAKNDIFGRRKFQFSARFWMNIAWNVELTESQSTTVEAADSIYVIWITESSLSRTFPFAQFSLVTFHETEIFLQIIYKFTAVAA